jgi:hypothetical protein
VSSLQLTKDPDRVRSFGGYNNAVTLHSRNGYDIADRFRLAAAAVAGLRVRSGLIDVEARPVEMGPRTAA